MLPRYTFAPGHFKFSPLHCPYILKISKLNFKLPMSLSQNRFQLFHLYLWNKCMMYTSDEHQVVLKTGGGEWAKCSCCCCCCCFCYFCQNIGGAAWSSVPLGLMPMIPWNLMGKKITWLFIIKRAFPGGTYGVVISEQKSAGKGTFFKFTWTTPTVVIRVFKRNQQQRCL